MSSIARIRKASITNRPSGGGNKLSGLPPCIGGNIYAKRAWERSAYVPIKNRNVVFCINQIGGIGRKSSSFLSTADGVHCVDNTIIQDLEPGSEPGSDPESDHGSDPESDSESDPGLENVVGLSCNQIFNPPDDIYSNFGRSVSITSTDDTSLCALIGCPNTDNGQINVYNVIDGSFISTQSIPSTDTSFGWVVSKIIEISDTEKIFITGIPYWQSSKADSKKVGAIKIYYYDTTDSLFKELPTYTITSETLGVDSQENAQFGYSLSVVKDIDSGFGGKRLYILVGEIGRTVTDMSNAGAAYIFTLDISGSVSNHESYTINNAVQITGNGSHTGQNIQAEEGAYFGYSVSLTQHSDASYNIYGVIGAPNSSNGNGSANTGSAYIFQYMDGSFCISNGGNNEEFSGYKAPETTADALFGYSVFITNLKDDILVAWVVIGIGAIGTNKVWLYNLSVDESESFSVNQSNFVISNNPPSFFITIIDYESLYPENIPLDIINDNMLFGSTVNMYNNDNDTISILISSNQLPIIYMYSNITCITNDNICTFTFSTDLNATATAIGYTEWTNRINNTTFDIDSTNILLGVPQTNSAQYFNITECTTSSDSCNCLPSFKLNNFYIAARSATIPGYTYVYILAYGQNTQICSTSTEIPDINLDKIEVGFSVLNTPIIHTDISSQIYYYPILLSPDIGEGSDANIIPDQYIYKSNLDLSNLSHTFNTIELFSGSIKGQSILNDPKLYEILPVFDTNNIYMLGYSYDNTKAGVSDSSYNNTIFCASQDSFETAEVLEYDLVDLFNDISINNKFISLPAVRINEAGTSILYITTDNYLLTITSNDEVTSLTLNGTSYIQICDPSSAIYVTSPIISDVSWSDIVYYGSIDPSNDDSQSVVLNIYMSSTNMEYNPYKINIDDGSYNTIYTPTVLTKSSDTNTITEYIYLTYFIKINSDNAGLKFVNNKLAVIKVTYSYGGVMPQIISISNEKIYTIDFDDTLTTIPVIYYKQSNPIDNTNYINDDSIIIYIGTKSGVYAYTNSGSPLWNSSSTLIYSLTVNNDGDIFCGTTQFSYIAFDICGNSLTNNDNIYMTCGKADTTADMIQSCSLLKGCPRDSQFTCKVYT
jgi:hypothetical protein